MLISKPADKANNKTKNFTHFEDTLPAVEKFVLFEMRRRHPQIVQNQDIRHALGLSDEVRDVGNVSWWLKSLFNKDLIDRSGNRAWVAKCGLAEGDVQPPHPFPRLKPASSPSTKVNAITSPAAGEDPHHSLMQKVARKRLERQEMMNLTKHQTTEQNHTNVTKTAVDEHSLIVETPEGTVAIVTSEVTKPVKMTLSQRLSKLYEHLECQHRLQEEQNKKVQAEITSMVQEHQKVQAAVGRCAMLLGIPNDPGCDAHTQLSLIEEALSSLSNALTRIEERLEKASE